MGTDLDWVIEENTEIGWSKLNPPPDVADMFSERHYRRYGVWCKARRGHEKTLAELDPDDHSYGSGLVPGRIPNGLCGYPFWCVTGRQFLDWPHWDDPIETDDPDIRTYRQEFGEKAQQTLARWICSRPDPNRLRIWLAFF